MRQPDENREQLWAWLLQRNARMYGVAFAIDTVGDVYLVGRLPLHAVTPEELDRLLGAVLTYADESLRHDAGDRLRVGDPARVGLAGLPGRVAGQPAGLRPLRLPRPNLRVPRATDRQLSLSRQEEGQVTDTCEDLGMSRAEIWGCYSPVDWVRIRGVEALIFDAIRTPRGRGKPGKDGKPGGSLYEVKPVSLVVGLIDEIRRRNPGPRPGRVDDIMLGCVTAVGDQGMVISRTAALVAGLPYTVAGVTLNRFCASGLEAVNHGGPEGAGRLGRPDPRRRRRVDVARPDGLRRRRLGDGPGDELRHRLHPAGHLRRPAGHRGGIQPRRRRRVRRALAPAGGEGVGGRRVRPLRGAGARPGRPGDPRAGRDDPCRRPRRSRSASSSRPSPASATWVASTRWRCSATTGWSGIDHVHTAGNSSGIVDGASLVLIGSEAAGTDGRAHPAGPGRLRGRHRAPSRPSCSPARRSPPARRWRKAGPAGGRHLALRGERGVRGRAAAVHARAGRRPRDRERQRRRHRHGPPARRDRRACCSARSSTSWSAAASGTAWPPSASAAAWASRPSSRGSDCDPLGPHRRRDRRPHPRRPGAEHQHHERPLRRGDDVHCGAPRYAEREAITGVVVTSAKDGFLAGADLKELDAATGGRSQTG